MRRFVVGIAVGAVVIAGCSSSSKSSSSSGSSAAQTRTVKVDNSTPAFNGGFLAYFPNQVTVHAGDTVDFSEQFSGEPHSVTLGTLVDKALPAAIAAPPNAEPPADFAALPVMLPNGPGDADQRAVNPCFVDSGPLPTDAKSKCANQTQPDFNGKQAYYSSGFLNKGAHFTVKLASDTPAGTYHYYCDLHGAAMSGTITVVGSSASIPSQADVDAAGASQLAAIVNQLSPAAQGAAAGQIHIPGIAANLAGFGAQGVQNGAIEQFFPATINAKVGQKVEWTFFGVHTLTFGAPTPAPFPLSQAPDGAWHFDPQVVAPSPAGNGGPPPSGNGPPSPSTVNGTPYNGTGFYNTGIVASFPPAFVTYSMTFTKAGTYNYVCLVHPGMVGQVVVK